MRMRIGLQICTLLAAVSTFAGACVTTPTNYDSVATYDAPVTFAGYTLTPNTLLTIEALNKRTGLWEKIGETLSSTGIALLLWVRRRSAARGVRVVLREPSRPSVDLLRRTGLLGALAIEGLDTTPWRGDSPAVRGPS